MDFRRAPWPFSFVCGAWDEMSSILDVNLWDGNAYSFSSINGLLSSVSVVSSLSLTDFLLLLLARMRWLSWWDHVPFPFCVCLLHCLNPRIFGHGKNFSFCERDIDDKNRHFEANCIIVSCYKSRLIVVLYAISRRVGCQLVACKTQCSSKPHLRPAMMRTSSVVLYLGRVACTNESLLRRGPLLPRH